MLLFAASSEDRKVEDMQTAEDALKFIGGFFERYPTSKERPLRIAGESCGGVSPPPPPLYT